MLFLTLRTVVPVTVVRVRNSSNAILVFTLVFLIVAFTTKIRLECFIVFKKLLIYTVPVV